MKEALLLLLLALGSAGSAIAGAPVGLLDQINAARSEASLAAVQADPVLDELAGVWAGHAAKNESMAHRKDLPALAREKGWRLLNENIYAGTGPVDAARVLRAWKNSPGHWRNLMNPALTHAGLGASVSAGGETYVVFNGAVR
ncbi:MAG: CAP domain-containing protein [Candidatus Methylacidiphilales bacterium]|nr:CAP domain-containing protein [Candidatus Methylacidiphilales bacterium]